MSSSIQSADSFLQAFQASGGWYDPEYFSLAQFDGMGWGGVAIKDIPAHTPLFHIPLSLLLTPYTSDLRSHLSEAEWDSLGDGWGKLILVMMYESERGESSKWGSYLASMPKDFSTPMLWEESEREALKGTDIEERIGKDEAEEEYQEKLVPILQAHPELFPPTSPNFSLSSYHIQGSRILSRSFTVPLSRSSIPRPAEHEHGQNCNHDHEAEAEEDREEEPEVAVMVPMADMLNAAYERDNARLFGNDEEDMDEEDEKVLENLGEGYTMISTKDIKAGDQIFNTYASPPNSELLRKYGHVDVYPLPEEITSLLGPEELGDWPNGNPGDEVVIEGDRVFDVVAKVTGADEEKLQERVDWWLEEGQDDSFSLTFEERIEPGLIAFVRLLIHDFEWLRAKRKGKLPMTAMDAKVGEVLQVVIAERDGRYSQTIQDDLQLIRSSPPGSNPYNAAVVRLGEKRVLAVTRRTIGKEVAKAGVEKAESGGGEKKRKENGNGNKGAPKRGRMKLA